MTAGDMQKRPIRKLLLLAVGVVLFAAAFGLEASSGALTAEFSGYPDAPSHYVSGLLVRDYLASGLSSGPMKFAQNFYLHYPYLAIGHWPPFFYLVEGVWMLLFSASRFSVMIMMALITTALALSVYRYVCAELGHFWAMAISLLLICVPVVQEYGGMVMLETLVALLSFWAVHYYTRFLETENWRDSMKFGGLASLAILTKGNAFYLALVPPLSVLLTRRFHLLKRPAFWLPVLIVIPVGLPWHLATAPLMLPTFEDKLGISFAERALRFYGLVLLRSLGPAIIALILAGFYAKVVAPFGHRSVQAKWAAAGAYVLSVLIFYTLTPAGIEARYMVALIPFLLLFFVAGADVVAGLWTSRALRRPWRLAAVMLLAILVFGATSFFVPKRASYGLREAAGAILALPQHQESLALVSSETLVGEGIFVSEIAMNDRQRTHAIIRASKVLADDDWNVTHYKARYASAPDLMRCLDETQIGFIVLDNTPSNWHFEHHRQLREIVSSEPDRWRLIGAFGSGVNTGHGVLVYESMKSQETAHVPVTAPVGSVATDMNGTLSHWPISMKLSCGAGGSSPASAAASVAAKAK